MKSIKTLTPVVAASVIAVSSLAAMNTAQAEVGSSATLASMYLWRGQDVSDSKPAMSGDITYKHESGAYASLWLSSGNNLKTDGAGYESDWSIGYAGKAGDVGYDVGYYKIYYPETGTSFSDSAAEIYLAATYTDFGAKLYLDAKDEKTYKYLTLTGKHGQFSALLGFALDDADANDYKHLDLSYAATDRLSFTYSKRFAMGDGSALTNDPLIMMSYAIPVDLK